MNSIDVKTSKGNFKLSDLIDCESYFLLTMDWYECKLKDLLKSQGIQITDKTYIIKV